MNCPNCDRPKATPDRWAEFPGGARDDLCWGGCHPHDWRGECLSLRSRVAELEAREAELRGALEQAIPLAESICYALHDADCDHRPDCQCPPCISWRTASDVRRILVGALSAPATLTISPDARLAAEAVTSPPMPAPVAQGEGCEECGGRGFYRPFDPEGYTPNVPCPACHGTGKPERAKGEGHA